MYMGIFRKTNKTKYFPNTFINICLKHNQPLFQNHYQFVINVNLFKKLIDNHY